MFHFLPFGRGRGHRPNSKKKKNAQTAKKKHVSAPSGRFFFLFGRVGVFIFLLFGRGAFVSFCCLGGWHVFFAVWAGAC